MNIADYVKRCCVKVLPGKPISPSIRFFVLDSGEVRGVSKQKRNTFLSLSLSLAQSVTLHLHLFESVLPDGCEWRHPILAEIHQNVHAFVVH